MSVITTDILVEGYRRDDVLAWLSAPAHHAQLLRGAFDGLEEHGVGDYTVVLRTFPLPRRMTYRFDHVDSDHGGRRVHVATGGKRLEGHIRYSLRTEKPSTNTRVTLHADFSVGGPLGMVLEQAGLRQKLESGYRKVLENLREALRRTTAEAS